jgi:PAS domain S-box-containing protein
MSHLRKKAGLRQSQPVNSNTKKRQIEEDEALYKKKSQLEGFRTLYESLPCICLALNSTGRILAVTQFGAAYLGYRVTELTQKSIASVFAPEEEAIFQAQLAGLQQQANPIRKWELRLMHKNGSLLPAKASACLVPGTQSNPIINLVCEEITPYKPNEETAEKSEESIRVAFEETRYYPKPIDQANYPLSEKNFEHSLEELCAKKHNLTFSRKIKKRLQTEADLLNKSQVVADFSSNLKQLHRLNTAKYESSEQLFSEYLQTGCEIFKLSTGIVSQINGQSYLIRSVQSDCDILTPGLKFELKHTYCAAVVEKQRTIAYTRIDQSEPIGDPSITQEWRRQSYIGTPIFVNHQIYGTLNFSSSQARSTEFEAYEQEVIEMMAQSIGSFIAADQGEIEHQQMLDALQEKEARFRAAVEGSLDSFFVCQSVRDETGCIEDFAFVDINSNGEKLISMSKAQVLGKKLCELLPINRTAGFFEKYVRVVETGEVLEEEFPISVVGITASWLHHQVIPLADGIAITTRDITERKQAEEALRQQFLKEQLIRTIAGRIHQSLNLKEILNTTVAEVRKFLDCDRVLIFRLRADGSGVVVVESVGGEWIPMSGTVINDHYLAQSYIQLYQQGRIQAVEDIYTATLAPCHRDLLAQFQVRANLVVPIVHEEQLWGLLVAQQCSAPRQWQTLEIDLLKSLSTQAAIAIQQSELYQQAQAEIIQRQQTEEALRQQFQRERLIGAIAGRIRRSLKLEKILNATVAEVRQVLQTDRVIIFRFQPNWSGNVVVESVASSCFSIRGRNIYDPCFEQEYVLPYKQGRVLAVEDIYAANLDPCHLDLLAQIQVRANLVVPIVNNAQLWGLLVAHHCCEPRQWQPWEIDLLSALAAQAAIAIQHSQLYEQAKSHFLQEQLLNQLTQAIRSSLDLETIFATAVREIGSLLEVDYAHIVQYLPEQKLWLTVSEYRKSLDLPVALGIKIPDENNPLAGQLKRLEIVRIHDTDTCEHPINQDYAKTFPGAWLLVPLHFGDSVWGSLGLVKNMRPYHWQDWQVELICAVAAQIAIAIQQAELYQQSRSATAQAQLHAQQLEQALIELQNTQGHLVQSEKMSSLGQLVAGVAHEINNPVSFIYGNLVHASGYTQDILGLIELYQQHYPHPVPEIQSEIDMIDLEFLAEDLPKLLNSMKLGAERICEIVAALRNFSRIAEAEVKAINLHEGLDSTLMILQNRLKASGKHPEIQVIREYGNLPLVECYAGQLNQVFMNLLVNAIDAIDEQNQKRSLAEITTNPSFIRVCTELVNDHEVAIRIADNGPGMTEDVKRRLFDPFFTTKPLGTGTGLGLSISYQIVVDKHGGQLRCYSQLGQGTEFVIQIPLLQGATDG